MIEPPDRASSTAVRPDWVADFEELFERRFRLYSIETLQPKVEIEPGPFVLSTNAWRHEPVARRLAGDIDDPVAIAGTIEGPRLRRTPDERLVIPCRVARWSQLVAMRLARDPAYGLYAGGILMSDDLRLLVNHRSASVRFYPGHLASFGGSFVPHNATRAPGMPYDADLSAACLRELTEETGGIGIELPSAQEVIVLLEQDRTEIGDQHSVHVVFTQARVPQHAVNGMLSLSPDEGTVCTLPPFGPNHLNELAAWFLGEHGPWAPCGLAHYLIWLRLASSVLPEICAPLARDLFDRVTRELRVRGSWQHPKWMLR